MSRIFSALILVMTLMACAAWSGSARAAGIYDERTVWLDDQAQPFSMLSLSGTPTVLTFAYGACRRVCASSLRTMQQVQALADQRHLQMNFVVVGLDPAQDRPDDWAQYRAERGLMRPNWQFLTGTGGAIRQIAQRLGVRYWRYGEHTMHDFRIVLLSTEGSVIRTLDDAGQPLERLLP